MAGANAFQVDRVNLQPDYLQTRQATPDEVTFSRAQLSALERVFPEIAGAEAMTEAQVRHRLGQRSVIAFIRDKEVS